VPVDARIIASTQPGLPARVAAGDFREDLYYRLHVAHIVLPPLRERPGDVASLARHFMTQAADEFGMPAVDLDERRTQWLCAQRWPGNVRELRNVVERAVLLGEWPDATLAPAGQTQPQPAYPLDWTLEEVKQSHMRRVLEVHHGNKSKAARQLGVSRRTLERKLGMPPERGPD
jgi:two-component system NtrC family response regulator